MAGSGATLKKDGKPRRPLYGWGIYFAESITKSDEYARPAGKTKDHCSVLVCRVLAGMPRLVTEASIDEAELQSQVLGGPCHSVLGDRRAKLGKPFREVVVYSHDQVFPEFLLTYKRL